MWWRDGVLYQVYPRSFADSDGDGVGDLRGITAHLDHLEWLGVDGLWLNPTFPSPNADWGFDVSDYCGVHPELGTLEDLDELVARAGERGIRVLLDLVPNHTSDQHPWFRERRDFYVWREGRNGDPPNNWKSNFGGPAWTRDEASGLWYLHNFTPDQPDLDWWNEDVRAAFDDILRFWMQRGVAGFRIDVAHGIVKDRELRDNPPATEDDTDHHRWLGQQLEYSMNRDEVHDVFRRWRAVCDPYDGVLLGETWVLDLERLMRFYGEDLDELHLAFNFVFLLADFEADAAGADRRRDRGAAARARVADLDARQPRHGALPDALDARGPGARALRAHDAADAARDARPLLRRRARDARASRSRPTASSIPSACSTTPSVPGRDGARSPMPWSAEPGAGFSAPGVEPWLPLGELAGVNVAEQRADPRLGAAPHPRPRRPAARGGGPARRRLRAGRCVDDGLWAYRRGDGLPGGAQPRPPSPRASRPRARSRSARGASATARRSRGRCCWRPARASCCASRSAYAPRASLHREGQHEHAAGDRGPRPRARRQAVAHERAAAGERALPGQRGAEGAHHEGRLAGRRGVGDRGQADDEPGEGRRGGRVDGGEGEEARDQAMVGGRQRAVGGRAAQRDQPVEADGRERGGGGERDRRARRARARRRPPGRRRRRRWRRGRRPARCPGRPGTRGESRRGRRGRR